MFETTAELTRQRKTAHKLLRDVRSPVYAAVARTEG